MAAAFIETFDFSVERVPGVVVVSISASPYLLGPLNFDLVATVEK